MRAASHQPALGPSVRESQRETVAGAGEAGVDDLLDACPFSSIDRGAVAPDDRVVLPLTSRYQQHHLGALEAAHQTGWVVKVQMAAAPFPENPARRPATGDDGSGSGSGQTF